MKQVIFVFFICIVLLLSCTNRDNPPLLSLNNLTSFFITINSDSGYNLNTPNGAQIKIAANSFEVTSNTSVKIEIKEAYSMQDILLGGLSTESNGKPLRSAGMLYFSATADNKNIKFLKPVQATIPAKQYDSSMQVFKGEIKDDSTINWVNPQAVDTSPDLRNLLLGKALFKANCASCHKTNRDYIGPSLAYVRQRTPYPEWAYNYVNNSNAMFNYDNYARRLTAKYGSRMTQFHLKKSEIKSIYDYCDNEFFLVSGNITSSISSPPIQDEKLCGYDTFYYSKPKKNIKVIPFNENLIDTIPTFDTSTFNNIVELPLQNNTNEEITEFEEKGYKQVTPEQGLYQININESGWYNVDVLFKDSNATLVQLFVKIQMQPNTDMTVYLCVPKRKVLMNAGKHKNDIYIFNYSDADGYLPLVLNDDAIIFASATIENKIYYGITKFKVIQRQTISVTIKESTKEEVLTAFKNNQLDNIKLDVEKKEMEIIGKYCEENPKIVSNPIQSSRTK